MEFSTRVSLTIKFERKHNYTHFSWLCYRFVVVCVCVCLQAKHAVAGNMTWGVDGDTGRLVDMKELGVWDPLSVKVQTYKTAIEVCI